ncbi:unnamed protein product [Mucor hiemalis]
MSYVRCENFAVTFATSSTPDLTLPTETLLTPIERNFELINREIANLPAIVTACKNTTPPAVGFDAEWKIHTARNDLIDVIQIAYSSMINCQGALELGTFCPQRKCISSGSLSLSDFLPLVLDSRIAKNKKLSDWACYLLSTEQICYAAIKAWAGLAIYYAVAYKPVFDIRVNSKHCELVTVVALKPPTRKTAIAYVEPIKPGDASLPSHKNEPSFHSNIAKSHLMIEDRKVLSRNLKAGPFEHSNPTDTTSNADGSSFLWCTAIETQAAFDEIFASSVCVDEINFLLGYDTFSMLTNHHSIEVNQQHRVFARVVKDIFHLMDMIKSYQRHGLYKKFSAYLSFY